MKTSAGVAVFRNSLDFVLETLNLNVFIMASFGLKGSTCLQISR